MLSFYPVPSTFNCRQNDTARIQPATRLAEQVTVFIGRAATAEPQKKRTTIGFLFGIREADVFFYEELHHKKCICDLTAATSAWDCPFPQNFGRLMFGCTDTVL